MRQFQLYMDEFKFVQIKSHAFLQGEIKKLICLLASDNDLF